MRVFIENEAGKAIKNIFDEINLAYIGSRPVSAPYPYPYGFAIDTLSGDGDNLDCFVLTNQSLKMGEVVDAEPLALVEMKEDGEVDHKVIACLAGENRVLDQETKDRIVSFLRTVFAHIKGKQMEIGRFLPREQALAFIEKTREAFDSTHKE